MPPDLRGGERRARPSRKGGRAGRIGELRPNDFDFLIEKGAPAYTLAPTPDRVCVIACGALAREILDILAINRLEHVALTCLPAKLHNTPQKIVPEMARAIAEARVAGFTSVFCGYADCGTGGLLDALLEKEGVARLPGAHCYAFFSGAEAFTARGDLDMRSFFLTDFLARHFDALTFRPLGLDRHPELRDAYFGAYERVVFLSQAEDPDLLDRARAIAAKLGLEFEHRPTGYGDLSAAIADLRS